MDLFLILRSSRNGPWYNRLSCFQDSTAFCGYSIAESDETLKISQRFSEYGIVQPDRQTNAPTKIQGCFSHSVSLSFFFCHRPAGQDIKPIFSRERPICIPEEQRWHHIGKEFSHSFVMRQHLSHWLRSRRVAASMYLEVHIDTSMRSSGLEGRQ
jgi:hypothetical protein